MLNVMLNQLQHLLVVVGVSGGAEVATHVMRRLATNLPDDHVVVKLDYQNAYNTVRRDSVLDTFTDKMPVV